MQIILLSHDVSPKRFTFYRGSVQRSRFCLITRVPEVSYWAGCVVVM
jgi:hypothetical protein